MVVIQDICVQVFQEGAINEFESLHLADKIEYKFNGTYYRVGLHISENEWQQANIKHGLPFWILH